MLRPGGSALGLPAAGPRGGNEYLPRHLLLPLENRLAAYLLSQAEDGWFHGTLTRTAETLSTSYRQLTRVMSRFAQAGYLRRTPEGWRLEEPDALQALAESVEPSRIL